MEWALEIVLILLLGATLWQALRLERALGVLRRDRAALEQLVVGFNASTRQAEQGIERLRAAADGAGRQIARQVDAAGPLRDDLAFLAERGERLADRLEALVRSARYLGPEAARPEPPKPPERDAAPRDLPDEAEAPRLRSQAERDLVKALRMAR